MLFCEDYQNYRGPSLISATLDDIDITEKVKEIYGKDYNWQGYLWTYKEAFGKSSYGKNIKLTFQSDDGREHLLYGFINDIDKYFNTPLHTPFNQT
tara:strand:+ start:353 stop:640 length:288 start_codon:yes stop_codon:yes gene_type:complete